MPQKLNKLWSSRSAILLSAASLILGTVCGWFIHGSRASAALLAAMVTQGQTSSAGPSSLPAQNGSAAQLLQAANAQAATLLAKLKSDPENPDLLITLGNLYYDAQQYPDAITYYGHALRVRPNDADVRTDMGTAYWYTGDADSAIREFDRVLTAMPDNPNTLFNRGLVRWKGKNDGKGALADWEKLLAVAPAYQARTKVEQMMAEVQQASSTAKAR